MDAHGQDPQASTPAPGVRDPEWGWWLGATVLFLAVLTVMFVRPATHAAGPVMPVRPLAPHVAGGGDGHGAATHADAAPRRSDEERAAELMAGLAGYGVANDKVPPHVAEEIRYLIRTVAESGHTFVRDETVNSAVDEAEHLLRRWETATTEIYSAESFIRRFAGYKLVDLKLNRVRFADGTSRPIADWLRDQLRARPPGP